MALSRRHELDPLKEPEYEMEDVPRARPDCEGSAAQRIESRSVFIGMLAEMVLLTNRAGEEYERKAKEANEPLIHPGKALGLEYMADRVDTDDPLWGWTIRTVEEGWLQGYVCVTTFTTWQRWFRWDSLSEASGILPVDRDLEGMGEEEKRAQKWWDARVIDGDGRLARALNRQIRDGDWTDEGVVWPRLAEVSLLGGLGCGGLLLDAVIEELSTPVERQYDYIVVQATENAVPFYESRGFVRVGAIARYEQKLSEEEMEEINEDPNKSGVKAVDDDESLTLEPGVVLTGTSSPCDWVVSLPQETPAKIAKRLQGIRAADIVFLNRRLYPALSENSLLIPGTRLRVPRLHPYDLERKQEPAIPFRLLSVDAADVLKNDARNGEESSNGHWYRSQNGETIKRIAKNLSVDPAALTAFNRGRYGSINDRSALQAGTTLWIPERPLDLGAIYSLRPDESPAKLWTADNEERTIRKEEIKLHKEEVMDPKLITFYSTTKCDDISVVEGKRAKKLSEVMAYRHWTFPDDPLADMSSPSYMMALPLKKEYLDRHVPSMRRGKSALAELRSLQSRTYRTPPFDYREENQRSIVSDEFKDEQFPATSRVRAENGALPHKVHSNDHLFGSISESKSLVVQRVSTPPVLDKGKNGEAKASDQQPGMDIVAEHTSATDPKIEKASFDMRQAEPSVSTVDAPLPPAPLDLVPATSTSTQPPPYGMPRSFQVTLRSEALKTWRHGPLEGPDGVKVFFRGLDRTPQTVEAYCEKGGPKPRPPVPPKRPTTSFLEFCYSNRPEFIEKNPGVIPREITLLLSEAWNKASIETKQQYELVSQENRILYHEQMEKYKRDLQEFHATYGLDEEMYDVSHPQGPKLKPPRKPRDSKKPKLHSLDDDTEDEYIEGDKPKRKVKRRTAALAGGHDLEASTIQHMLNERALPPNVPRLFNKVVILRPKASAPYRALWLQKKGMKPHPEGMLSAAPHESPTSSHSSTSTDAVGENGGHTMEVEVTLLPPPPPSYYFTLTYIPDLRWCRLAPLQQAGIFKEGAIRRKGYEKHVGRNRWVLAPESTSKEIDVSSFRCIVAKAVPVKNVTDADQEEWDIM